MPRSPKPFFSAQLSLSFKTPVQASPPSVPLSFLPLKPGLFVTLFFCSAQLSLRVSFYNLNLP